MTVFSVLPCPVGKRPTDVCDGVGTEAKFSMPLTLAVGADTKVLWVFEGNGGTSSFLSNHLETRKWFDGPRIRRVSYWAGKNRTFN